MNNSGKYWICVDACLRVSRKQKLNRPPSLTQTIDGVWLPLGKKAWQKCRVGMTIVERAIPEDRMRLVAAMRQRAGSQPS